MPVCTNCGVELDGSTPENWMRLQAVAADGAPFDGQWCSRPACLDAARAAIVNAGGRLA